MALRQILERILKSRIANPEQTILDQLASGANPVWIAPTLLNGWSNYASGYNPAGYYKDGTGRVWLRGLITGGTSTDGTIVLTLPTGYRPTGQCLFATITSPSNIARCDIQTDGGVAIRAASSSWISLEGISFTTT